MELKPEDAKKVKVHIDQHLQSCLVCGGRELAMWDSIYELRPYTGGGVNLSVGVPNAPALLLAVPVICQTCYHVSLFRVEV